MLIGEYTHTLDSKKRLSMPSKFRKEIGGKAIITRGLDKCLFVYTRSEWKKVAERIAEMSIGQSNSRGFNRFILSGAVESDVDSGGRILIPDFLKEFAGLKNKVVVAGVYSRIEIWDEKEWSVYKKKMEGMADALAEKLGEVGMI